MIHKSGAGHALPSPNPVSTAAPSLPLDDASDDGGQEDLDSLFSSSPSSSSSSASLPSIPASGVASRRPPPIPGLFFFPGLLSPSICSQVVDSISRCGYFSSLDGRNQAMLFARAQAPSVGERDGQDATRPGKRRKTSDQTKKGSDLPDWATGLIEELSVKLHGKLEDQVHDLLFSPYFRPASGPASDGGEAPNKLRSRQLILNLYKPGDGLSSHVDLMRFGDGIMLASFGVQGQGTVMEFSRPGADGEAGIREAAHALYLPPGSVLVLSGEARYGWKHGIPSRHHDLVREGDDEHGLVTRLLRGVRLSVTIRWMEEGGDIVGEGGSLEQGPVPM